MYWLKDKRGQGTVEYLIVGLVLLGIIVGLGALAGRLAEGLFVQHAADGAAYGNAQGAMGAMGDVLLY
ncbi:MAG: hypothetical protein LBR39_00175 [Coriobacteriales bacterium]|jgi:Flp pilus assembly pilin Flp|nr:hypothetical protein [Coriobacteriales bacterium]